MIDTHTHLYLEEFDVDGGGRAAVERAVEAGVERMIFPNVDLSTIQPLEELAAMFPGVVYRAMGLHPTEVDADWQVNLLRVMERLEADPTYVAVGEIGVDLYWSDEFAEQQMKAFDTQVARAVALDKPVIIHCREALAPTLEVLSGHKGVRGVFHSFGGDAADVEAVRRVGDFYFGINGIVTFKNSRLRETLPAIGLDRILLETDSPYLAPVPRRGKRNESAFLPYIAEHVAAAFGVDTVDVDCVTTASACSLFGM